MLSDFEEGKISILRQLLEVRPLMWVWIVVITWVSKDIWYDFLIQNISTQNQVEGQNKSIGKNTNWRSWIIHLLAFYESIIITFLLIYQLIADQTLALKYRQRHYHIHHVLQVLHPSRFHQSQILRYSIFRVSLVRRFHREVRNQ